MSSSGREGGRGADLDSILAFVAAELGADAALLSVQDRTLDEARICSVWGQWRPLEPMAHAVRAPNGSGSEGGREEESPVAVAMDSRIPASLASSAPELPAVADEGPIADALIAPVRPPSGRDGALALGYVRRLASDRDRDLALDALSSYAALFGLWLDDAGSLLRLVSAAYRDALTGCVSYAALIHELEREVRRSERTGRQLSCLFIDVDEFKAVNDVAGHEAANRVLIGWARKLMRRARQTDVVGRYGGDEFVVVLPDTGRDGAWTLAEALRSEAVEAGGALDAPVSVSIGIAEWERGLNAGALIAAADLALQSDRGQREVVG